MILTMTTKLKKKIRLSKHATLYGKANWSEGHIHVAQANPQVPSPYAFLGKANVASAGDHSSLLSAAHALHDGDLLVFCQDNGGIEGFVKRGGELLETEVQVISKADLYARHPQTPGGNPLMNKAAAIIGLGMGGRVAELLVQAGLEDIILIDYDTISPFLRHPLAVRNTARSKTLAWRDRLLSHNPWAKVEAVQGHIEEFTADIWKERFGRVKLLVACTDSVSAQFKINELCVATATKSVFAGYYTDNDNAWGGEIVWVDPGKTACYNCIFESSRGNVRERTATANAIAPDIDLVGNWAAAYSLALLGEPTKQPLLDLERNIVFMSTGSQPQSTILTGPFQHVLARAEQKGCRICTDRR